MCGIVGIASVNPVENRNWLKVGNASLRHRGPDGDGEWWSNDGCVGLAHRRLAVMDLSDAGHQPMLDDFGGLAIIFNGEIYNFGELRSQLFDIGAQFRSHSDTEVILQAYKYWGRDCLSKINGMFAFAIYDTRTKKIFLARDRAGEKPLFYMSAGGQFRFASELKALLADGEMSRRIFPDALDCYLAMGYIPGDLCILDGYKKLPAAHAIEFDLVTGRTDIWRYWDLPGLVEAPSIDENDLLNELEQLLEASVRSQLLADVPVGILLSGGVDSSLIAAMAVRSVKDIKAFTVRFSGYSSLDETEHARLIAHHFGMQHIELDANQVETDILPKLACQFDEPMADSSMIPTWLVSNVVRNHCTVALGGDGGDELFGGYGHHSRLLWLQARLGKIPMPIRKSISWSATNFLPIGLRGRNWLQSLGVDLESGLPMIASFFDADSRKRLLPMLPLRNEYAEDILAKRLPFSDDLLQRSTRMDFKNYLCEDILVKVDRASMYHSLEMRAPFLDRRLVEFAYSKVPSHLKATTSDKKILLKRLTERVLPTGFDRQRKQGFSIPLAAWLKGGAWRDFLYDVLLDSSSSYDKPMVRGLLSGMDKGRSNGERIFCLAMFELWRRQYGASL